MITVNSFSFNINTIYSVTIGAGGAKREPTGYPNLPTKYTGGTSGGNSIFSRTNASGGNFEGANNAGINKNG